MTSHQDQDDVALAQEMERLLAVEPSAEFHARVRSRIRHESIRPRGFRFRGWLMLSGTVAAAAYVVLVLAPPAVQRTSPQPQASAHVVATPPSNDAKPPSVVRDTTRRVGDRPARRADVSGPASQGASGRTTVRRPEAAAPRDPFSDVQVSASELKALRQLGALLASGRLQEEDAPLSGERHDVATELVIAPIVIEPIQLVAIKGEAE